MRHMISAAGRSIAGFVRLSVHHGLHLRRDRLGASFLVAGGNFAIFRETVSDEPGSDPTILVISFRLKLLRSNRLLHWCFRRICICTTPFWSGLPGFKTKLWMVDPQTHDYLGIYDWRGQQQAQDYINFLLPILRFFSIKHSVQTERIYGTGLEAYLQNHVSTGKVQAK